MKNKEEVVLRYEDRLLKNEKSWRRARIGAVLLFFVFLITIFIIYGDDLMSKDERYESLIVFSIWCLFWMMIFEILTLRIRHIDSVNIYRKKIRSADDDAKD